MLIRVALFFAICSPPLIFSMSPMFQITHLRAELVSYDKDSTSGNVAFHFGKINRTSFALNASYTVAADYSNDNSQIQLAVTCDKLFGTQYKRTGTKLVMNMCKFWKSNAMGVRASIEAYGNLTGCEVKPGFYSLTNFLPSEELFPKILPYGSYRLDISVDHKSLKKNLVHIQWYAKVDPIIKQ